MRKISPPAKKRPQRRSDAWQVVGERVQRRPLAWVAGIVGALLLASTGIAVYKLHADWLRQFRTQTDGTRGYAVLKSGFPAGALAPTTVVIDRADGPVRAGDVRTVRRLVASAGAAQMSPVQRRSRDGRAVKLSLTLPDDPYGAAAFARIGRLRHVLAAPAPGVRVLLAEGSARQADYKAAAIRDTYVVASLVLAVVLLTLIVLLRAVVAPLAMLATVVLSYFATIGISLVVFHYLFGQHLVDPELLLIVFIFLIALGSDYNIFLMSRLREEVPQHGTREGMQRALTATGPVITSAGLILAGTFSVLMVLPIWELLEIGFAVALGVLLDTFVVRSVLLPAIVWVLGGRIWWPFPEPRVEEPALVQPLGMS